MSLIDGIINSVLGAGRQGAQRGSVDPRLKDILTTAAQDSPFDVKFVSEYRPGDSRQHGKGRAIDVQLVDRRTGKALPNYQDARNFRDYEQFAQRARSIQQAQYPELDRAFRWGGYFSGKKNYGAMDLMHFDLGGMDNLGMAGGTWEGGLTAAQRKLWPGIASQGMASAPPRRESPTEAILMSVLRGAPMTAPPSRPGGYTPVGIHSGVLGDPTFLARIRDVEQQRGVPPGYLHAIIAKESRGDPNARSPADKQGLRGWGLGQFRNATAQWLAKQTGVPIWQGGRVNMDPDVQLNAMAELLKAKRKAVGGDWGDAAWAYNAGEGNVLNYRRTGQYGKYADRVDPNYREEVLANRQAILGGGAPAAPRAAPSLTDALIQLAMKSHE